VEEQGTLEVGYPPDIIWGDRLVLSVVGVHKAGGDDDKTGCGESVSQHLAEDNYFSGVDSAVVRRGESENTWAGLLIPETEGSGIEMGSEGLVGMTPNPRETADRPWYKVIFRWWVELVKGVRGLQRWCCVNCGGREGVWASEVRLTDLVVDGVVRGRSSIRSWIAGSSGGSGCTS